MEYSGLPYGDNKAINSQAAAAPVVARSTGGASAPAPRQAPAGPEGIFAGTDRPHEPLTAGIDFGPGAGAAPGPLLDEDPNLLLRALVAQGYTHPDLVRMLNRG